MIVTDQKISEMIPKMASCDTLTGCGSLGLKTVWTVYRGLVPMSPKTTPRAPSARAPCAVARRLTLKVLTSPTRYPNERSRQDAVERASWRRDGRPARHGRRRGFDYDRLEDLDQ